MMVPTVLACYWQEPEPEPEPIDFTSITTWVNPQYRKVWLGEELTGKPQGRWIDNPLTESYWLDGRFYVVFPHPYWHPWYR